VRSAISCCQLDRVWQVMVNCKRRGETKYIWPNSTYISHSHCYLSLYCGTIIKWNRGVRGGGLSQLYVCFSIIFSRFCIETTNLSTNFWVRIDLFLSLKPDNSNLCHVSHDLTRCALAVAISYEPSNDEGDE
jgi:hypothetical protein